MEQESIWKECSKVVAGSFCLVKGEFVKSMKCRLSSRHLSFMHVFTRCKTKECLLTSHLFFLKDFVLCSFCYDGTYNEVGNLCGSTN